MRNDLSGFGEGSIFIDANIFVYHAAESKYTESATAFLEKVENNEIETYTSPSVIDEAAYILIINKGLGILDSKSPRKVREKIEKDKDFAKKCYSVLEDLIGYVKSLETLKILEITGDDAFRIYDHGIAYLLHPKDALHLHNTPLDASCLLIAYLLHPKDALHLAVMKRYRIFNIATNDSDFERVEWVKVWNP